MSDDFFYAKAYGRVSNIADTRARMALAVIDGADNPLILGMIREDLQRILEVIAEVEAEKAARNAAIYARLPVEVLS